MFRKFFSALASLTTNTEALAASVAEANTNFRERLGLDGDPEQIEHRAEEATVSNGRKRVPAK